MPWYATIAVLFVFASLLFLAAAMALRWAHRDGQFNNLDDASRSIFDEDEPEGVSTDRFPRRQRKRKG